MDDDKGEIGVFRGSFSFDQHGDPYEISCTVQRIPDGGLEMKGGTGNMGSQLIKLLPEIREMFKKEGIKYLIFERISDGEKRKVKVRL